MHACLSITLIEANTLNYTLCHICDSYLGVLSYSRIQRAFS